MSSDVDTIPPRPPEVVTGEDRFVSFWDIVQRQFLKNKLAVAALWSLIALILMAVFAPLIALNIPFVISDADGVRFPLFIHLFDGHVFASGVDMFFNLMLVVGPIWWLSSGLFRSLESGQRERVLRFGIPLAILSLFLISLTIHYWWMGSSNIAWEGPIRSVYVKLMCTAGLGVLLMFVARRRTRHLGNKDRRPTLMRIRYGLLGIVGVALFLIVQGVEFESDSEPESRSWMARTVNSVTAKWSFTAPAIIYRDKIAKIEEDDSGWAISPPLFFHPDNRNDDQTKVLQNTLHRPSFSNRTLLGCDNNGRDVLTRLIYGARISLTIGIVAVSIYVTIGVILGSIAGYFGGKADMLIMFVLQVLLCIPGMFLILTIIALFDTRSIFMIMVAIGLTSWTGVTRLVRGEFFRQRSIEYVTAAQALGIPEHKIIFGHILKNAIGPVLVSAAFGIAGAVLTESFLAFLGLGDTNAPSWGQILQEGQTHRKAWLLYSPGLAIFYLVTVLNIIGEGLRDALDPKLRT